MGRSRRTVTYQDDTMSAEGKPHADDSLLALPLRLVTRLVLRLPHIVLAVGFLAALLSIAYTVRYLGFRTSRLDLLNPKSAYNQRWLDYLTEFGEEDDAIVVVEGQGRESVVAALDDLAETLSRQEDVFRAVMHKKDLSALRAKGLHFLTVGQLEQLDYFVGSIQGVVQGDWNQLSISRQSQQAATRLAQAPPSSSDITSGDIPPAALSELSTLTDSLLAALDEPSRTEPLWKELAELETGLDQLDTQYLLTDQGRLGLVLLRLQRDDDQLVRGTAEIDHLRRQVALVQQRHADVKIGVTGMPVLENDEMLSSQNDMVRASLLSLVGVAILFIVGFGGIRHPLLTVATLLVSMAWAFGYVTAVVGHLNILSVSFGVILIGLGIDFGIHYVARYLQLRRSRYKSGPALLETAASVGPGIVTGGVTTAIAFFAAGATDFTGVAELGVVAGGGIVLCVVGALLMLPAMVYLSDRHRTARRAPRPLSIDFLLQPILRFPRPVLIVGLALSAVIAAGTALLRYDHNLLNLQPRRIESVRLERRLTDGSDRSVWFAISMADTPDELRRRKALFDALDCVDHTEEIVSLLPRDDPQKRRLIADIATRLDNLPARAPLIAVTEPRQLDATLARLQGALAAAPLPGRELHERMQTVRDRLQQLPSAVCYERISDYQQRLAGELLAHLWRLRGMADPATPQLADLPSALTTRFVGVGQRHLLRVYARGNVWDMDQLEDFVRAVERVDPRVTGHPVQTYYASRQMLASYVHAALYALLAVAIVLMLDFRSIRHSLLALLPMLLGMLQLFGILGLLDLPLNPANMIVLPLILGIGIDDGVHVVHDFCRQKGPYRLSSSTATAVLLTSLTTMVGFGTMMFARHQGLRSLGQVLTIGVFCCLCTSIVILPALLSWMTRHRGRREPELEQEDVAIDR